MKTVNDGFQAIEKAKQQFLDGQEITKETANLVGQATSLCAPLRDYLIGLPSQISLGNSRQFIETLITQADEEYLHVFYTVLSAFLYELGERDLSYLSLYTARSLRPDYALIELLAKGCFETNWRPEIFVELRNDLNAKTLENIMDMKELSLLV